MPINLPTSLTLFRVVLVPVVAGLMCLEFGGRDQLAALGFGLAVLTDWFDGWLARRWQQESDFGAFLDPVADKLLVCTVLILFVYQDPRLAVALPVVVIVGRELTISALREWMAGVGARGMVAVGAAGKYKTSLQMIAIFILLFDLGVPRGRLYDFGLLLLWVASAMTIWSMVRYLQAAWPRLRAPGNPHLDT